MLSLKIKSSNVNHPYGLKSSQWVVLWDSNLIFDRKQLSAVRESLLCDYPMKSWLHTGDKPYKM